MLLILRFHCWLYGFTVEINSETVKSTNVQSKINLCTKSLIIRKKNSVKVSRRLKLKKSKLSLKKYEKWNSEMNNQIEKFPKSEKEPKIYITKTNDFPLF
jgi:hypothetical protein